MEIILASASLQRKELLKKIIREFKIVPADIDENIAVNQSDFPKIAEKLALKKAEVIAGKYPKSLVIGADTIVELGGRIYGKPKDDMEAVEILKELKGTVQRVITGIAVLCKEKNICLVDSGITQVKMKNDISDEEIENYVKSGEGENKAGSYAVQKKGDKFIEWMKGDYYNVVGLPLRKLSKMLKEAKVQWNLEINFTSLIFCKSTGLIYNKSNDR